MRALLLSFLLAANACAADFVPLDKTTARKLVESAQHTQATAVVLWSYDCPHCKQNLKQFAQLAKRYPQLKIISIATDPASPELRQRLDATGLPGIRYAYGNDAPEALAYAIDPSWHGELPRTLLFDGKGGKVAISGVESPKKIQGLLGLR
ncbi:MAG TPA: redoxin domain-containing protein [Rhodocyclaceae bacterium]|nr:redoxin domain-containing protein [Rhodocyclaceae bacterium]